MAVLIAALLLAFTGLPLNGAEFFGILLVVGLVTHLSKKRQIAGSR